MGLFSLFSKQKEQHHTGGESKRTNTTLSKDFFVDLVDISENMLLYFSRDRGWVGANRAFLQTMGLHDIEDFLREYESVRDIFLNESEEIFTESDKSWLDYIKKYKNEGYRVTLSDRRTGNVRIINATTFQVPHNETIYVLRLKDITDVYKAEQKAKEVEKLKSKFLANIGHEFRTPMNV